MITYRSTRSGKKGTKYSADVIMEGIASDGGLFVPDSLPKLTLNEIKSLCKDDYPTRAAKVLVGFLPDYTYEELLEDCKKAYNENSFVGGIAPVVNLEGNTNVLELWHGPTAAFKDMALQIMPRLLSRALTKTGVEKDAMILVATSGDTGKAALEGYKDVDRVKIHVFYPVNGVSRVQKIQMSSQTGNNVCVTAINGNFDDAQSGVKSIFADKELVEKIGEKGYFFSSANSINWGRLAPQIVYYVSSYCDLIKQGKIKAGDFINVCVPTGNFGNIFAGYLAKRIGLPIDRLICASNSNNILTDFLETGVYDRNRKFYLTMSPSMDILISSNLERLLYFTLGPAKTAEYMAQLKNTGRYALTEDELSCIRRHFVGYYTSEEETMQTIKECYENDKYLIDTHTAVAVHAMKQYLKETGDDRVCLVISTASPYKFANNVYKSIAGKDAENELEALNQLTRDTGVEIPYPLKDMDKREIRFTNTVEVNEMPSAVLEFCK